MFKNLFKSIFKRNPTSKWIKESSRLRLDIKSLSLQGAHLGDPIEKLAALGCAQECCCDTLYYYADGINVCFNANKLIEEIEIMFQNKDYTGFSGTVILDNQEISRGAITTIDGLKKLLSSPTDQIENKKYLSLIYVHENDYRSIFTFEENELIQINFDKG